MSIFNNLNMEFLSKNQERFLLENRDKKENRDLLINCNIKYVISVAKKFQNKGIQFEDLISFGIEGLIKAIDKYDLNSKNRLITYAKFWIFQSIQINILKNALIKIPYNRVRDFNKIKREIMSGLTYFEALKKLNLLEDKEFFPEYLFDYSGKFTTDIEDDRIDLENNLIEDEKIKMLNQAINELKQKEKDIINMKLNGISNTDISEKLKISKQRIHQIYIKSQEKIKEYFEKRECSII